MMIFFTYFSVAAV